MLESKQPPNPIFRVARVPDPWQPPDWSRALPDGTFGNRFDDPKANYRVLYASSHEVGCYVETLARFRPDFSLLAEFNEIEGDDDSFPLGEVPNEWCDARLVGAASANGNYADVYASGWVSYLRGNLAGECLRLGIKDLDAGILQNQSPRLITQLASLRTYEHGFSGVYYRSRFGHDLENWALFEPFHMTQTGSKRIFVGDPALKNALDRLGLKLT